MQYRSFWLKDSQKSSAPLTDRVTGVFRFQIQKKKKRKVRLEMEMEGQKKKKIMVAIDESEYGSYALEWALQNLHDSMANKELLLFTAQPISDYNYLPASSYGSTPPELIGNIQEYKKKIALNLLNQAKDLCSKYGIAAETVTDVGDPKELICEAVEKFKIQLLVVGSHSRGALKRVFLGSVSNHCVQNVKCPVLVVKKTE